MVCEKEIVVGMWEIIHREGIGERPKSGNGKDIVTLESVEAQSIEWPSSIE